MLILPACEKKIFLCQIRLLHKAGHHLSGFHATETPCKQPGHKENLVPEWLIWPRYNKDVRCEKSKGHFPKEATIVAGAFSLSRIYFANRKLLASCLVDFVRLHLDDHCSFLSAAFPAVKRRYFYSKSGLSTNGIVCLVYFKLQHSPMYNSVLGEKWQCSFWSKPPLELVFMQWVQYSLHVGRLQTLVLRSPQDYHHSMLTYFTMYIKLL